MAAPSASCRVPLRPSGPATYRLRWSPASGVAARGLTSSPAIRSISEGCGATGRVRGPFGRLGIVLNPYHHYIKRAEKKMFTSPRLRAVICNSRMVKDEIRRYFNVLDGKLHVIYSGVDTEVFHPRLRQHRAEIRARYSIPENATLFLFVGSGFERKGVPVLLEAMAGLPESAFLLVVGRE